MYSVHCHSKQWSKKVVQVNNTRSMTSWQQLSKSFLRQFQATKEFVVPLDHLGNVKQKKEESLKSYLNRFTMELFRVRWAPDVEVLAYLTNGVLPELHSGTSFNKRSVKVWASSIKMPANSWSWRTLKRPYIRFRERPPVGRVIRGRKRRKEGLKKSEETARRNSEVVWQTIGATFII